MQVRPAMETVIIQRLPLGPVMQCQLRVLVVQPDSDLAARLACAISESGHDAVVISAASWAVPLVREEPPDVVVVERTAPGFGRLLEALDDLELRVPVLVTRFSDVPRPYRATDAPVFACLVRRVEDTAWQML